MNEKKILRREQSLLGLVGSAHFLSHFYLLSLPMLFLAIKADFGVSFTELGLITAIYAIGSAVGQYPIGVYADRYGPRWFLIGGLAVVSGAFVLMGFSDTYWQLVILALIAGLGDSVFHPADYILITNSIDQKRLGRSYAFHTFLGFVGFAAAPLVVVPLKSHWDWRFAVTVIGIVGLALVVVLILKKNVLTVTPTTSDGDTETSSAEPIGAMQFLKSPPILMLFVFYVSAALAGVGIQQFSPSALPMLYGVDETMAGRALFFFVSGIAVGILVGGFVADKTSKVELVASGAYVVAIAMVTIIALVILPFYMVIAALFVSGFMSGVVFPSRDMLVRSVAPKGASGKAFGFVSSGFSYGWFFGPILFGWIMDKGFISGVYLTSGLFMLLVILAALVAGRYARRQVAAQAAE